MCVSKFLFLGISFTKEQIPILFDIWFGVLNEDIKLRQRTSSHNVKAASRLLYKLFETIVRSMNAIIQPNLTGKFIASIDLLANGIEKFNIIVGNTSNGNTWESTASTHVQQPELIIKLLIL